MTYMHNPCITPYGPLLAHIIPIIHFIIPQPKIFDVIYLRSLQEVEAREVSSADKDKLGIYNVRLGRPPLRVMGAKFRRLRDLRVLGVWGSWDFRCLGGPRI